MRPLTPEEIARARKLSTRQWRKVWLFQVPRAVLYAFVFAAGFSVLSAWRIIILLVVGWFFASGPLMIRSAHRKWRRDLEADLTAGMVEQKTGHVYDRFYWPAFFTSKKYIVWAEGIELKVDRSEYRAIQLGDTLQVDYLPRTHLVIAAQKVASP